MSVVLDLGSFFCFVCGPLVYCDDSLNGIYIASWIGFISAIQMSMQNTVTWKLIRGGVEPPCKEHKKEK